MSLDNSASVLPDYIDTTAMRSEAEKQATQFSMKKDVYDKDAVLRKAQGIPEAATNLQSYKTDMENAIQWFTSQNKTLKRALATSSQTDYAQAYNTKKATVEEIKKTVEEQRELDAIRQEQVKALENREAANYHTSWLGLQRPMSPESQVGLLVAAGFFAMLAILGGIYIYKERMVDGFPDTGYRGGRRSNRSV
jgi:hypothetical protein